LSLVLGWRQVCDGPNCESPDVEGEVCHAPIGTVGWITREKDGQLRHFCEEGCELDWMRATLQPTPEAEEPVSGLAWEHADNGEPPVSSAEVTES
jgi:hypothetical protein